MYIYITYHWPPRISTTGYWSTTTNRGGLMYIYILLTTGPPESVLLDTGPLPPLEVDYCIYILLTTAPQESALLDTGPLPPLEVD